MKTTKVSIALLFGGLLCLGGLVGVLYCATAPGHENLEGLLINLLNKSVPLSGTYKDQSNAGSAIYVLGGSDDSLRYRFKIAANLYQNGVGQKLLIERDQSLIAFDPSVGRNRMFYEWMIRKLVAAGVAETDIEPVSLEKGFFGTYQEAKGVSGFVSKNGYANLILVTSAYHTARTWRTFSKFMANQETGLYIYPVDDAPSMGRLLVESVKLGVYSVLLL